MFFIFLFFVNFQIASASLVDEQKIFDSPITLHSFKIALEEEKEKKQNFEIPEYPYNPYVDLEIWNQLKPYFLPFNHPTKHILSEIFEAERVTLCRESFIAAGFKVNAPKNPGNLVVGKHPRLKEYLVKAYLDTQDAAEWDNFFKRVTGALSIQQSIDTHGYQKQFDVPKKWIYPLPFNHLPPNDPQYFQKNFILIVEDAHLLNHYENAKSFKNKITSKTLNALHTIITEEGLIDSLFRGNIPFNKRGKICFIDTEHHHLWPIKYEFLLRYLSPEMQSYWQNLTGCGAPVEKVP